MSGEAGNMNLLSNKLGPDVAYAVMSLINKRLEAHCVERHDTSYAELYKSVLEHEVRIKKVQDELTLAELGAAAIKIEHEKNLRKLTELQERNDRQASTINMYRNAIADMKAKLP